jgi:hypothetical protein
VSAIEVSPDGKTLAFIRDSSPPDPDYPDSDPCGSTFLVLRDLATGVERSWPGEDGSLSSLAWSSDSRQLAYVFIGCCGDYSPTVHVLDTATAPRDPYDVPGPTDAATNCMLDSPAFAGQRLLVNAECYDDRGFNELRDGATGGMIMQLPDGTRGIRADASGQHLLVTAFTDTAKARVVTLYVVRPGDRYVRKLSETLSDPHW